MIHQSSRRAGLLLLGVLSTGDLEALGVVLTRRVVGQVVTS